MLQETDPPEITGGGPDTKTIDRYFTQMCDFNQLQKLSIPVSLTTSMAAHDVIAYVKPDVQVTDALISQVQTAVPVVNLVSNDLNIW